MMWAKQKSSGFTLVELLIVIVVIAILAAIAIISYNGITERAQAVKAATAVDAYVKLLNMYKSDHGTYPMAGYIGYYCLGETKHYPAADGFSAGRCDSDNSDAEVSSILVNALSAYTSSLPDPTIPPISLGATNTRGLVYFYFSDELSSIHYRLKGDVPCPRGSKSTSTPGTTDCEVQPAQD